MKTFHVTKYKIIHAPRFRFAPSRSRACALYSKKQRRTSSCKHAASLFLSFALQNKPCKPRFRFASSRSRAAPYTAKNKDGLPRASTRLPYSFPLRYKISHAPRFRFASSRSRAAPYTAKNKDGLPRASTRLPSLFLLCMAYFVPNILSPASPRPGQM